MVIDCWLSFFFFFFCVCGGNGAREQEQVGFNPVGESNRQRQRETKEVRRRTTEVVFVKGNEKESETKSWRCNNGRWQKRFQGEIMVVDCQWWVVSNGGFS